MKRGYFIGGAVVVILLILGALFIPSYLAKQGVDRLANSLPAGDKFTYQDARYSLWQRSLILKGGVLHVADPAMDVDIAEIRIKEGNPDLDHAIKDAQATPNPDDKTETKVAAQIVATGLHTVYGPLEAHADMLEIDEPRLALHRMFAPLPPLKSSDGQNVLDMALASNDVRLMLQRGASGNLAVSYDGCLLTGLDLTAVDHVSNVDIKMHIGKAEAAGMVQGNTKDVSMEDLKMETSGIVIEAGGLHGKVEDEQAFLSDLRDGQPLSVAFNHYPKLSETINDVIVTKNGSQLALIGDITIGNVAYQDGFPSSLDLSVKSLRIDPSILPDANSASILTALGYKPAIFDFSVSYAWDLATRTLAVSNTSLTLEDGGTISANASLADIAPGAPPMLTKITNAMVHYQDNSLAGRWIAYVSKLTGRDATAVKSSYVAWLEMQKPNFVNDQPISAAIESLEKFVADPHALTLAVTPATPVGLAEFDRKHPETFSGKLGLTLTNEAGSSSPATSHP